MASELTPVQKDNLAKAQLHYGQIINHKTGSVRSSLDLMYGYLENAGLSNNLLALDPKLQDASKVKEKLDAAITECYGNEGKRYFKLLEKIDPNTFDAAKSLLQRVMTEAKDKLQPSDVSPNFKTPEDINAAMKELADRLKEANTSKPVSPSADSSFPKGKQRQ